MLLPIIFGVSTFDTETHFRNLGSFASLGTASLPRVFNQSFSSSLADELHTPEDEPSRSTLIREKMRELLTMLGIVRRSRVRGTSVAWVEAGPKGETGDKSHHRIPIRGPLSCATCIYQQTPPE